MAAMQTERYFCSRCSWYGDEPFERSETEWYDGHPRQLVTVFCPICFAETLDEVSPCEECGERPVEVEDWCKDCHAALEADGLLIDL